MKDDDTVLAKSTIDKPFEYLLKLRTGEMIFFTGSRIRGKKKWLHLEESKFWPIDSEPYTTEDSEGKSAGSGGVNGCFPRGINVRVSDIVWIMDAPFGS